jgi:2'-phosphotransferase
MLDPSTIKKTINMENNNPQQQKKKARLRQLSHTLSWALRHKAHDLQLPITSDGYVPIQALLQHSHARLQQGWTLDDVLQVVETNEKQRFHVAQRPACNYIENNNKKSSNQDEPKISSDETTSAAATDATETTILCIRASQGHTISTIDPYRLLTRLSTDELLALPMIVHGTYMTAWLESIRHNGLNRMARNHIHFATGLLPHHENNDHDEEDSSKHNNHVISGMRKTCDVYIFISPDHCCRNDDNNTTITFFKSANGVILTAGVNDQGILPVSYFSHVTDKKGNVLLDNRSTITISGRSMNEGEPQSATTSMME